MDRCNPGVQLVRIVNVFCYCALLLILFPGLALGQNASIFEFEFSPTTKNISNDYIKCFGNSSLTDDTRIGAMCLTPPGLQSSSVSGRCFYMYQLSFNESNSYSFSTMFSFNTLATPTYVPGEGFTFNLGPQFKETPKSTGGYLGWLNETTDGKPGNNFAVEFDIYQEHIFNDTDSNHVGINLNSLNSTFQASLQMDNIFLATTTSDRNLYVWIDYDGVKKTIDVSISLARRRPCSTVLSAPLDLEGILLPQMYAGFSSSTGSVENDGAATSAQTTIIDWSFSTVVRQAPNIYGPDAKCNQKDTLSWPYIVVIVVCCVATVLVVILYIVLLRRTRRIVHLEMDLEKVCGELLILDYGPKEYSYKELSVATNKFSPKHIIGKGGFGIVYKGVVSSRTDPDVTVAIKKIHKKSSQGIKEFVAEVKVIGRLRHVNMVPLLGWSVEFGELLLVYEFMPNNNLQELLFPDPLYNKGGEDVLPWDMRLRILRGVAAALVFLHDDCEQRVVHRDVKSSNVLLDQEWNARLGDFGLARLYDRSQPHHSTNVAGTIGYMAPETVVTGNATTKSDVYSFGAMVLETVTGRRPADWKIPGGQGLVKWVWKLHDEDRVLEAVDPRLGNDYDEDGMRKVMKMGLFCCMPDPEYRPSMRQVQTVLQSESPILSSELPPLKSLSRHLRLVSDTQLSLTSYEGSVTDWGTSSFESKVNDTVSLSRSISESQNNLKKVAASQTTEGYLRMQSWS